MLSRVAKTVAALALVGASAAAQSVATVSGTIRHNGNPLPGVMVQVDWDGGGREVTTGENGVYALSGVPTGGQLQILVRPPVEWRLAHRNWETRPLRGDLVKDFDLDRGNRVSGECRGPDGNLLDRGFWLEVSPVDFSPPPGERLGIHVPRGRFDFILPPGRYLLVPASHHVGYPTEPLLVDLRAGDVAGLVIALGGAAQSPPARPPQAGLISVGPPDPEGYAAVTGASGAVEPGAEVAVVNLSARTMVTTSADAGGGFTARLYAPPGSALLVRYDPLVYRVAKMLEAARHGPAGVGSEGSSLPGTIIHAGGQQPRQGGSQPFHAVGAILAADSGAGWAGWWLSGTVQTPEGNVGPGVQLQPGQRVKARARVRITSPALNCAASTSFRLDGTFSLHHLFAADGRATNSGIWFNAYLFTPTGLPIEHEGYPDSRAVGGGRISELTCVSAHAFEGSLDTDFNVPGDIPPGIYPLSFELRGGDDIPLSREVPLVVVCWYHNPRHGVTLPVTVGRPAPPRIPWTLLTDYPVNGHRGVGAREDQGRNAMVTRTLFAPHQVIVPPLEERTGERIAYRLEPGSSWFSMTDRSYPTPPLIALSFPSGSLTVQVRKPDGSIDTLGPALIRQSAMRTPTTPGGAPLDDGTGHIGDAYHLTTLEDAFAYRFPQYGRYEIRLSGAIKDVYGNSYPVEGTYDVWAARVLDLDPGQLPTTPYVQGDAFAPGLHIFPPVAADVTVRVVQMPNSDPARAVTRTIHGRANRFGYFQPAPGTGIRLEAPGEFRVDLSATYTQSDGTMWAGAMTWGNVVEGPNTRIEAHGRRGMDYYGDRIDDMPAWYEVANLPSEKVGVENYYPYFSGDVHWGMESKHLGNGDSIHPAVTIRDRSPGEKLYQIMRSHWPRARGGLRRPPRDSSLKGLNQRLAVGEAPLFITAPGGRDPTLDPGNVDLWAYWYGSSERPDVRVREVIAQDHAGTAYWRFNDTYGYQIGEGAWGDRPGDIKWEFGGAVFRVPAQNINEYAIYSSLWVLLPDEDPVGARVAPPFQDATGASINGGPIMKLKGKDIDMLFLPKGVRPGDVLEVGDTISFSGHVGPPLDSVVSITITSPSGVQRPRTYRANKIGWVYDPAFDFVANEAGRWTVHVFVLHDRPYVGNGVVPQSHNTGTVLGTEGRYEFYVVAKNSPRLQVTAPDAGFLKWTSGKVEPVTIRGSAPADTSAVHYTIHDKGVVMGEGILKPASDGAFSLVYDARELAKVFPFVSLTAHEGRWEGLADEVAINFLAVGGREIRANTVTLIGEEVFVGKN